MPERFNLHVNGVDHPVEAEADTPLLYILRNDLQLKGARFGCGEGQCGACKVIMDGKDVNACDTPLWSAAGRSITTVEGLGSPQSPHPLQRAFIDEQAAQCGYCTTGMIIAAKVLLDHDPRPSEARIAQALERNLCRCGTHNRILRAIRRAAALDSIA